MRVLLLLCLLLAGTARADAQLDARTHALAQQLRCLVCQNQTIADSHAPLAVDLKNRVRDQLAAGKSEAQVIEDLTAKYGDFVLYNPPVKPSTWLLWAGPALLGLGALAGLAWTLRRRAQQPAAAFEPDPEDGEDPR
ncbi:cytochrome c-type biogenesis protein [Inhella proteolytica]|uniref:Cytochrome c-type biogenesis protein n=1 Tax=Inhella proteolytica TaxID=2795029 RepID=A0A931J3T8_9BURK|nr:cytochrome c-type biogenesis protein [Inhella proteolytica]MBH9577034.1 cytochrome c-type biogenesis protein CcmH [Inhella proteolytica]